MPDTNLIFTSYNCKSFEEDKYTMVKELIYKSTFVLLQEHWQYEKQFINNLKLNIPNIECVIASPMDENEPRVGRDKGGVAIIWQSNLNCKIECAVRVSLQGFNFLVCNVYMPTDPDQGNYDLVDYNEVLREISEIMLNSDTQYIILGGDWNTDISRFNNQTNTFKSFTQEESLSMCLSYDNFNVPYTFNNREAFSTIDHFLMTGNLFSHISKYESILNVDDFSDHMPVILEIDFNVHYYSEIPKINVKRSAWHKCTAEHKMNFKNELDRLLLRINIQQEALTCADLPCTRHTECIASLYYEVVNILLSADSFLQKTGKNPNSPNIVAGWNGYVKEHRDNA